MTGALHSGAGSGLHRDILTTLLPGFEGLAAPEWLTARLADGLGGVCLFGMNVADPAQLSALTAELRTANPDAVVAIDEEGGEVTRLWYDRGSPFPGNAVLGRIDDVALTAAVAGRVGRALDAVGVTATFAPDVDVNSNPDNPVIGTRSFGADPGLVARHAAAWTTGVQSAGIAAAPKHFPGHGDTATDSHLALPVVDRSRDELADRELVPFRAAVAAGARLVMTSHILLPQLDPAAPATLSPSVLGMLRDELGFTGVIVSDALDMRGASAETGIPEAAVRALAAGCDLLCIGAGNTAEQLDGIVAAIEAAVASGRLPAERVAEAAGRVRGLAAGTRHPDASRPAPAEFEAGAEERARIAASFRVAPSAAATLAAAGRIGTVVRVDAEANIAVGDAPWGPFAAAAQGAPGAELLAAAAEHPIDADDPGAGLPDGLPGPVVVVGRDLHRYPAVRRAIDAARAVRDDVVAIDTGWPSPDFAYADVATFGASRLVGEVLLAELAARLGVRA